MRIRLFLGAAALALTGCYTQLYTRGYAERTAYGYPYGPADSAGRDSAGGSVATADSVRPAPQTIIVNQYYEDRPYYRGYPLNAWEYPYFSLSLYSGRYRDYYGPYWWNDPYPYHRGYRRHYDGNPGGGGSGSPGPYRSERRIFPPAPSQPPLEKGRRSEPAQAAPAPKTAPSPAPAESSSQESGRGSGPSESGGRRDSNGSGNDHPALHKGKRR